MSQKQLLTYYQSKVDQLYKQRLGWLSKFDQCASAFTQKQNLMEAVADQRLKNRNLNKDKVYHNIALIDEKLNVVKMQRDNIFNQYQDAHQILRMQEILEQYPQEIQKKIPCNALSKSSASLIKNQLNIHNRNNNSVANISSLFRQQNAVLKQKNINKEGNIKKKILYKPSAQELLRKQIFEINTNQQKQICLLQQQKRRLKQLVGKARQAEQQNLKQQRQMLNDLKKNLKDKKNTYQKLADKYFVTRDQIKKQRQSTLNQKTKLQNTLKILQKKIQEEIRIWQKQNKAKQTLIQRKSQDFIQDYKARMRAKQRNLQALRDNYEKMQQVCIQKIRNLQQTLTKAQLKLNQTTINGEEQIKKLKQQLSVLQNAYKFELNEKARLDQKIKQKIEKQKRQKLQQQQRKQLQRKKDQKARMIQLAYKKTTKPTKKIKNINKSAKKPIEQPQSQEDSQSQQSMAIQDLQNIRQQINRLDSKVGRQK